MGGTIRGLIAIVCLGCGTEEPVPSCQDAITHFYGVGCTFIGNTGAATSQMDALNACNGINVDVPDQCRVVFNNWKRCLASVDSDAMCGDCSGEGDALFACD